MAGRVALALGSTVLAAEVLLRILGVGAPAPGGYPRGLYAADEALGFRLAPDFTGVMDGQGAALEIRTNGRGFRDDPFVPKARGAFRILALGDSFGFGHGVAAGESYPELVGAILDRGERPVEVLNLGVPGYNTLQELELLADVGGGLEPDLVLLGCYLGNDISGNLESRTPRPTVRHGYLVSRGRGDRPDWWIDLRATLKTYSRTWGLGELARRRLARREILRTEGRARGVVCEMLEWSAGVALALLRREPDADSEEAFAITRRALLELARLSRESLGVPFVLVLLPSPYQYHPLAWSTVVEQCGLDAEAFDLRRAQTRLLAVADEGGFAALDLTDALAAWCAANPSSPPFADVHFNASGHLLAAEEIARFLGERGLLP